MKKLVAKLIKAQMVKETPIFMPTAVNLLMETFRLQLLSRLEKSDWSHTEARLFYKQIRNLRYRAFLKIGLVLNLKGPVTQRFMWSSGDLDKRIVDMRFQLGEAIVSNVKQDVYDVVIVNIRHLLHSAVMMREHNRSAEAWVYWKELLLQYKMAMRCITTNQKLLKVAT